ncbi:hypothetical protein WT27_27285 [Burkholderia territorii]|uniref:SDR family oxidoreductase n=1 Tax=Burkholderia territorii TaxID=1503055 RepID=A0A106EA32_9BURK|nr:SDR family oxidoreductase [Burkholderia territorii]KVV54126.1 hypothetical protein WT27_27285 [Burkholderia territorii]KVX43633.1 hypothetical protein WT31_26530 [Burkholderia territorii]
MGDASRDGAAAGIRDFDPSSIARIGKPEEVASLVLFPASDESVYCTGSEFIVDGEMLAGSTFH